MLCVLQVKLGITPLKIITSLCCMLVEALGKFFSLASLHSKQIYDFSLFFIQIEKEFQRNLNIVLCRISCLVLGYQLSKLMSMFLDLGELLFQIAKLKSCRGSKMIMSYCLLH